VGAHLAASGGAGSPLWFLSRGSGVVVVVLLTVVVVLGVVTRRGTGARGFTFVASALHRNASLLAVALLVVHIVTAVLDPYVTIRWVDAFVPFTGLYRPLWLGFGALALDLLIALVITSLLRLRLGVSWWRRIHWAAYLAWPVALLHGAGTGTDTTSTWDLALTSCCVAAVVAAVLFRARLLGDRFRIRGAVVRLTALGGALAFGGWLVLGPLAPGWAARSGTPAPKPPASASSVAVP
jgi:methionine sulfoxide reductase heme-binding subunit